MYVMMLLLEWVIILYRSAICFEIDLVHWVRQGVKLVTEKPAMKNCPVISSRKVIVVVLI